MDSGHDNTVGVQHIRFCPLHILSFNNERTGEGDLGTKKVIISHLICLVSPCIVCEMVKFIFRHDTQINVFNPNVFVTTQEQVYER